MAIEKIKILATALPIQPIHRQNGSDGLNWQCCLAGSSKTTPQDLYFFQLPWVPIIHLGLFPLRPTATLQLLGIINFSRRVLGYYTKLVLHT